MVALVALGCNFDTEGLTGSSSAGLGSSSSGGEAGSSSGDTSSSGSTSDPSASGPGASTNDTMDTGDGPASLDVPGEIDLGLSDVPDPVWGTIELANIGTQTATDVSVLPLNMPFVVLGETCSPAVDPGETCEVDVQLTPPTMGPHETMLRVEFNNGIATQQVSVTVRGAGRGSTPNLVANPGAETQGEPPPDWSPLLGNNWRTTTDVVHAGSAAFTHGNATIGVGNRLGQTVDIGTWAAAADSGSLQIDFEAFVRKRGGANLDTGTVTLEYLNGGNVLAGGQLYQGVPLDWERAAEMGAVPTGTRQIRIVLECTRIDINFGECQINFDDVRLVLSYP